jgi:hypothetical protein
MSQYNYLPSDELDDSKLNGIYRVSFEIQVKSEDALSLSDVTQALTEGFQRGFGADFVEKVAELSVEKITKKAVKVLKIGDKVYLKENLKMKANIYNDDGYLFVGQPTEISETVTSEETIIDIEAGSIGYVNKINKDGSFEVADLDRPVTKYTDAGIDSVNIDLVTVSAEQVEKIDSEEVK